MGIKYGLVRTFREIWDTVSRCCSLLVFYPKAKQVHPRRAAKRIKGEFRKIRKYYSETYRPTKKNAARAKRFGKKL